MKRLDELIKRVKEFDNALTSGRLMQQIIWANEAYILDMNAEEQLYEQGINRLGVSIASYAPYSPITIQIKKEKGQPTDRVTLRDEGDFQHSFYLDVTYDSFRIAASDWKTEDLTRQYGDEILGLTNENKAELTWQYIYPDLLTETKKIIYG